MSTASAVLWKNLARRRGLLEEYKGRPFEVRYFGVHFRLREPPSDEDRLQLYNMAAAVRERINGRPMLSALGFIEEHGRLPNIGIFRRSGAILINGHLAAQVIRGLIRLSEMGFIPPVKASGGREPDPYDAMHWRNLLGGEGYIKVELLWTTIPEGCYPAGSKIMFSGRERMAVWRISYDDSCVLVAFRNWANPVHASRLLKDAAALKSLAERHASYYTYVSAIIISTRPEKAEAAGVIRGCFRFKTHSPSLNRMAIPKSFLVNEGGGIHEVTHFEGMFFSHPVKDERSVALICLDEYTQPKQAYSWIKRSLPIPLAEAYGEKEELSPQSLEAALNAILSSLHLRYKLGEKVRKLALEQGARELREITSRLMKADASITPGIPREANIVKALHTEHDRLEMQKKQKPQNKQREKTQKTMKQAVPNNLMYNHGGNHEISVEKAPSARTPSTTTLGQPLPSAFLPPQEEGMHSALGPPWGEPLAPPPLPVPEPLLEPLLPFLKPPPRPPPELMPRVLHLFFMGLVRGEGFVQPCPFKAKVRVYCKSLSRNFKPYRKPIHHYYIAFTGDGDPFTEGRSFWFPVSSVKACERSLFARSLEAVVDCYWKHMDFEDRAVGLSRDMLRLMILMELKKAAGRIKARKYRVQVKGFMALADQHISAIADRVLSRVSEAGVPLEPWAKSAFLSHLQRWVEVEGKDVWDLLICYRYRGYDEREVLKLIPEEERSGFLFEGAPVVDPDLPPRNSIVFNLTERWEFWYIYVARAVMKANGLL